MKKEWFASWFDSRYYHILYKNRNDLEAARFIDNLLTYLRPTESSYILDLACGAGRHSIYLNQKGFNVHGVDLSSKSIELANKSIRKDLKFSVHDMRDLDSVNRYTHVFNLFTSFGYFDDDNDNNKVVSSIFNSLKPEGIFILDFLNAELISSGQLKSETKEIEGVLFEICRELDNHKILKSIIVHDGDKTFSFQEKVTAFSMNELLNMLQKKGFKIIDQFGNYNFEAFNNKSSPRSILVAQKPSN